MNLTITPEVTINAGIVLTPAPAPVSELEDLRLQSQFMIQQQRWANERIEMQYAERDALLVRVAALAEEVERLKAARGEAQIRCIRFMADNDALTSAAEVLTKEIDLLKEVHEGPVDLASPDRKAGWIAGRKGERFYTPPGVNRRAWQLGWAAGMLSARKASADALSAATSGSLSVSAPPSVQPTSQPPHGALLRAISRKGDGVPR